MSAFSSSAFDVDASSESAIDHGSVPVSDTPATNIGGVRVRRRKMQPYVTTRAHAPVSADLYSQMFPTPKPVEAKPDEGLPAALLAAWMAGFDD